MKEKRRSAGLSEVSERDGVELQALDKRHRPVGKSHATQQQPYDVDTRPLG
jgi:hypothetical protein